jgi:hypothetical protein
MPLKEIEIFVAMNEDGDYEAAAEAEVAQTACGTTPVATPAAS